MDFGDGVSWRQLCCPTPTRFASFHTCIHEKFMTVFSVSLTLLVHSHPPPQRYTFSPINPLRGRLSERMLQGGNKEGSDLAPDL